jgi:hemerythrin-like domain-containing protein
VKRHPSLHPLSEHHHHALVQALEIRRLAGASPDEHEDACRRVTQDFLQFWEKAGRAHFREEEEILLPAYARHTALNQDPDVMQMLADHAAIRAQVQQLAELFAAGASLEATLADLGRMLQAHVRLEEDHIFPRMESVLGEAELQSLASRLTPLHGKKRGVPAQSAAIKGGEGGGKPF